MFVTGTTDTEIIKLFEQLKNSDGIGNDGIPCLNVNSTIEEIAPSQWLLISHLKLVFFHDKLKIAKNYPYT